PPAPLFHRQPPARSHEPPLEQNPSGRQPAAAPKLQAANSTSHKVDSKSALGDELARSRHRHLLGAKAVAACPRLPTSRNHYPYVSSGLRTEHFAPSPETPKQPEIPSRFSPLRPRPAATVLLEEPPIAVHARGRGLPPPTVMPSPHSTERILRIASLAIQRTRSP